MTSTVRRVLDGWRGRDVAVRDLPLALLVLTVSLVLAPYGTGTELGGLPSRPFDGVSAVIIVAECLPLALLRSRPLACLVLVSGGFAADQLLAFHSVATLALPVSVLCVSAYLDARRRLAIALLSAAYVLFAVALYVVGRGSETAMEFVTFYGVLAMLWIVGSWLRARRQAEEERRRRIAEETRAAERARIARELHDVVTHHVTAMVLQAEAAQYLTKSPDRLAQNLSDVAGTGRRAITDLRHLLGLLDPDHGAGERTPSVQGVENLVEQARRAGQPVDLAREGSPASTPGGAELVAYRVVQEGLTNALKHAHGRRTQVDVRYDEAEIVVRVSTSGAVPAATPGGAEGGRGLAGLRERVALLGGDFEASGRRDGFVVSARIPAGSRS
ncbi:signal transduction histidine kinase [Nocardioides luteus]|uniref:histidine kinase n=1 Tax=Nocardioides luteus TaxID=1844 RepID=A0ABQ5SUN2_9ACTN|nr:histidine kinase [Nocardioides luteus]MDR7309461.1 signal transduction histidine kinase [Nocardioides luteus]GGR51371.1 two-component sensor histidine kinase [Nocardioides luteus]GLJ67867.1 two-component sensor histidine kinase [Nocardioides luteus]